MDRGIYAQMAQLRGLLHEMEIDLGFGALSRNERDVLLAFHAVSEDGLCKTERVRAQPTMHDLSQPTFHRALKKLIEKGFIEKSPGLPHGSYRLSSLDT